MVSGARVQGGRAQVGLARPRRVWRALVWVWRCRFGQGVLASRRRCFATSCIRTAPFPPCIAPNSSIFANFTLPLRLPYSWPAQPPVCLAAVSVSAVLPCRLLSRPATHQLTNPLGSHGPILLPQHDDRPARSIHGWHEFEQWLSWPTMRRYRRESSSRPPSTHDLQNPPSPNFPHPLPSRHTTSSPHASPPPDPAHRYEGVPNSEKAVRS
jgi:hypothetical protein